MPAVKQPNLTNAEVSSGKLPWRADDGAELGMSEVDILPPDISEFLVCMKFRTTTIPRLDYQAVDGSKITSQ